MRVTARLGARLRDIHRRINTGVGAMGGGSGVLRDRSNHCTGARHEALEEIPVPEMGREIGVNCLLDTGPRWPPLELCAASSFIDMNSVMRG